VTCWHQVRAAAAATLAVLLGVVKLNPAEHKGKGPLGSQRQMFVELQTGNLLFIVSKSLSIFHK